jgi:hypothetical protein
MRFNKIFVMSAAMDALVGTNATLTIKIDDAAMTETAEGLGSRFNEWVSENGEDLQIVAQTIEPIVEEYLIRGAATDAERA